jgi:transposase InsO family protein
MSPRRSSTAERSVGGLHQRPPAGVRGRADLGGPADRPVSVLRTQRPSPRPGAPTRTGPARCGPGGAHPACLAGAPRGLRGPEGLEVAAPGGRGRRPLHGGAADATPRPGGGGVRPDVEADHHPGDRGAAAAGPGTRQFTATRPNQLCVPDLTCAATWRGFVYGAFIIDVFSRRIVRGRSSSSLRSDLALDALEQALYDRPVRASGRLVHHSDRGVQYLSIRYTERLAEPTSSCRSGAPATDDNALAETVIGLFKTEEISRRGPGGAWRTSSSPPSSGSRGTTGAACSPRWGTCLDARQKRQGCARQE